MKRKIDKYWLYTHHDNLDSIFNAISLANLPDDFEVKLYMLISSRNLFSELKRWVPKDYQVSFINEHENLATLKISKTFRRSGKEVIGHLNLVRLGSTDVYVAISYEALNFVRTVMLPYFGKYYSNVSPLFITAKQIRMILDGLKLETSGNVITDRVVAHSKIDNKEITVRRRTKESDLRWTDEDYVKSFSRAAENDQWIDKISFTLREKEKRILVGFLSREGLFKCDKNLKLFFDTIIRVVISSGKEKIKLFKNRSRRDNQGLIKPLSINYSTNVFKDQENYNRLSKIISEFPKSSHTIYHEFPYLHVSLVDYFDGSSFDIWVLSENQIIIVPQIKASFSSISRLCEYIFKKFKEGKIEDLILNDI